MPAFFIKTELGRQEMAARCLLDDRRSRALLLMIDGKTSTQSLLERIAVTGVTSSHLQKLIELALIAPYDELPVMLNPISKVDFAIDAPEPSRSSSNKFTSVTTAGTSTPKATPAEKHVRATSFMNRSAKDLMGLFTAIGFQQKVALASTLEDLRKLRNPMVEAVTKSKGAVVGRSVGDELDRLLNS